MLNTINDPLKTPRYIAIEGGIGVGKTTLATALAKDFKANLMLEPDHKVPFLASFYQNKRTNAFTTQLSFLMHRIEQFSNAINEQIFKGVVVSDYCWDKDELFAKHNLTKDEYQLYCLVVNQLAIDIPKPDLVVYLQAPIDVLRTRINKRDRQCEYHIDDDYLKSICQTYAQYFHHYTNSALLIVNAGNIDWVNSHQDYQVLKQYINKTHHGKHFLNFESELKS